MTTKDKATRRKLSLVELAQEKSNVSRACRIMGYSRQQFYEIRRNYQTYGAEGLIDRLPGVRGPHPNRVSEEVEAAILAHALDHPTHRALRVAQELSLQGVQVFSGGVRGVHQARISTVLSDNRREFCGPPGPSSLRAVPPVRGHRAPHHPGPCE